MRKLCHRINGVLICGLLVLYWVHLPRPPMKTNIKVPDILAGALWDGCRTQGIARLKAHFLGQGWQTTPGRQAF